jgi:UDP-N-acetylmuramate--alanine ligase
MVVEADEFDRSLLRFYPTVAVITSIEAEHMECYSDLNDLHNCFVEFAMRVPFYGTIIYCLDDNGLQQVRARFTRPNISYGFSRHADIYATDVSFADRQTQFACHSNGKKLGTLRIPLLGKHNVLNSLAALAAALDLDIPFADAAKAMQTFSGVSRRLELVGQVDGITFIDDFAHHPTEIKASLDGLRQNYKGRIVVIFQPHLYTRTQAFQNEFGTAFFDSDFLVITDIYPSREKPIEGITGKLVAEAAKRSGHKRVEYIEDRESIPDFLVDKLKTGDIIVAIGAGDINKLIPIIQRKLQGLKK